MNSAPSVIDETLDHVRDLQEYFNLSKSEFELRTMFSLDSGSIMRSAG